MMPETNTHHRALHPDSFLLLYPFCFVDKKLGGCQYSHSDLVQVPFKWFLRAIWSSLKRKTCNFTKHNRMRAEIDLATWSTRSTKLTYKIMLGTIERFEKLQEKFEKQHRGSQNNWNTSGNLKYQESFILDLSQTQKIKKFSNESQVFIADLHNTEIFDVCENSSKQQCLHLNTFWETGEICCSCGKIMKSDITSIPDGFQILIVGTKFDCWEPTSSDESPCRTILIRCWVDQTHVSSNYTYFSRYLSSDGIFDIDNRTSSHFAPNSCMLSSRRVAENKTAQPDTVSWNSKKS